MQNFIDSTTQKIWAFEDDVVVEKNNGAYSFTAAHGEPLQVPATLIPYVAPVLTTQAIAEQQAAAAAAALALQANTALSVGLTVSSTSTPALNGTYGCDQLSQMDIIAVETSISAGKGFPPAGATTFNYPDVSGVMHIFTEANFTNFAAAVRDYVYALKSVIAGASTSLPPSSTNIG